MTRTISAEIDHLITILTFNGFGVATLVVFLAYMSFFATVSAIVPATGWTIFRKVTRIVIFTILHTFSRARLRAFGGSFARLLAVATCKSVHAWFGAVMSSVANLITVDTLDLNLVGVLCDLLWAGVTSMTELVTAIALEIPRLARDFPQASRANL